VCIVGVCSRRERDLSSQLKVVNQPIASVGFLLCFVFCVFCHMHAHTYSTHVLTCRPRFTFLSFQQIEKASSGVELARGVAKTQVRRSTYRVLGTPATSAVAAARKRKRDDDGSGDDAIDDSVVARDRLRAQSASGMSAAERDANIFDDTDFYQLLLREIIATGGDLVVGGGQGQGGGSDHELKKIAQRARKRSRLEVDRRASKGRKIRYTVIPALVNFMTPSNEKAANYNSDVTDELFTRLFGQRPRVVAE
jgi:hypothetical protein